MKIKNLKTVDVKALEWWDKVNGNSYFSALVTLNYGRPDQVEIKIPFQYGYGDQYTCEAGQAILKLFPRCKEAKEPGNFPLWRFCRGRRIDLRTNKERALKRECKALIG